MNFTLVTIVLSDNSNISYCKSQIVPYIRYNEEKIALIISGVSQDCDQLVKELNINVLIAAISDTNGNTCDNRVLSYGTDPSLLQVSFNIIFSRDYLKIIIIGGEASLDAHREYALASFLSMSQDTEYIGDYNLETDNFEFSKLIKKAVTNTGLILYFGIDQMFTPFMKCLEEYDITSPKYKIITYSYVEDNNKYEYEAVGAYFTVLEYEANTVFKAFIIPIISEDMTISEKLVNAYSAVYIYSKNIGKDVEVWSRSIK